MIRFNSIAIGILTLFLLAACRKSSNGDGNNNGGNQQGNYTGSRFAVSKTEKLGSPWVELSQDNIYTSYNVGSSLFKPIPSGFENTIASFYLPKGYMVVFAANADGTGESACFVANDSAIKANLPVRLRNNISYIRCLAINNPAKKGTASVNDAAVTGLGSQWYYSWGINKPSYAGQQYVPMTWGRTSCNDPNTIYLIERNDIDHLLSFNEPDNASQSNIPIIDTAIQRYKIMQKTGLRLGTPVVTQSQAFGSGKWLTQFMNQANTQNLRIDFIAVHWYDWGNETNNAATDSLTAVSVFNRFVSYIQSVRQAYPGYPIWVTEYNANINRSSQAVHRIFMRLSTQWMNTTSSVERYAYFFPSTVPDVNPDNSLTAAGAYWKSLPSAKSISGNIILDATLVN